jgi:hypothetical protein
MEKRYTACPSWLVLSEDRSAFILLPERAEIVRRIFELSLTGLGCYTIARQLNEQKVPAFGPSGRWDQSTIHKMLASRATIGEHQPKDYQNGKERPIGDPIPNYYPPVIDESLFIAVQRARQRNLSAGKGRKGKYITNIFQKTITCAHCGGPVKFHSNNTYKSLICTTVMQRRGCFRKAWSCKDFEKTLFGFLIGLETDPSLSGQERQALSEINPHIRALHGPSVFEARAGIVSALRNAVSELKIASAGSTPVPSEPFARIQRDQPGRYFEITLMGSNTKRIGFG